MTTPTHNAARVRVAGAPSEARKLAARLTRGGIAAAPDDKRSRAELIVALDAADLPSLRARAHKLLAVGVPTGPALAAGADDVVRAGDPVVLFRRVRALIEREDLEAQVRRLGERVRALEEGLAEAAHDIRSPLHAAIGHAQLLADDPGLDDSQRQSAQAATRQANRALQTCERILAGAQRPGERAELMAHPCDLTELVASAVQGSEALARQHGVTLSLLPPQRAVELRSDPELLSRLLDNLIGNAIRHSPPGGEVEVSAWRASPRTVRVAVKDQGPGIEAKDLVKLVAGLGPGRGLRICRDIAERHGGDLWAESAQGHGSRFIVELPLALDASRPQVLLVSDDDRWTREVAMALRGACDVRNIRTARARLPARRPDLVLVEAHAKGKAPALMALRTAAKAAHVPVVELPSQMGAGRLARALARLTA